jgi:Domain of unknown function (DUF4145)
MKCPYCGVNSHNKWDEGTVSGLGGWHYRTAVCPVCKQRTIELSPPGKDRRWRQVHPIGSNRGPVPSEVPKPITADYVEACKVLALSPKASAALSRRCLQVMLNDKGYKDKDDNLARQIDKLLNAGVLPSHVHEIVDAIRNFGNFGAHPINDLTTLQVIDVEPHEAEWCLEILEALFDHFYVRPEAAKKKKAALDAKLKAAGKPASK